MSHNVLKEGLNKDDLLDRVNNTVNFDEYFPKMNKADQVIVASFTVLGKTPSNDLKNFIEKGYGWVLLAETSPGEISDGNYLVFIEAERRSTYPENFINLLKDLNNITGIQLDDWEMIYFRNREDNKKLPLTKDSLASSIPLSPKKFREIKQSSNVLESMLNSARVPRKTNIWKPYITKER